jgi:hypothetical protein
MRLIVSSYGSTGASIFDRVRVCHVPCVSMVHNTCTCKERAQIWHLGLNEYLNLY